MYISIYNTALYIDCDVATDGYCFSFFSVLELVFQVYTHHIIFMTYLQPTVAGNDRLLILCDHTLLQLGTYVLTIGCILNTDDHAYACMEILVVEL